MTSATAHAARLPLLRAVFLFLAGLALTIGSVLFLFPEGTGAYFAWTIRAPIAAATLGGWFLGLGVLAASLARAARWSAARLAVPALGGGAALLLLATWIHRAAFNWDSPAAWIWLALNLVVPPGSLALSLAYERAAGPAPPTEPALTPWLRGALQVGATAYGTCGLLLFAWPSLIIPHWPGPILPPEARAHGAFLLAYAVGAWRAARAGAVQAAATPLYPFALLPLLAFAIPWLHIDTFHPATPGGILYLLLTAGLGLALSSAIRLERRQSPVGRDV